jgi:hypothetical protein
MYNQRKLCVCDVDETVAQVIDRAHHLIEDFSSANSVTQDTSPPRDPSHGLLRAHHGTAPSSSSTTTWQRPHHGRMKRNIDASFFESFNRTGKRMCIRDAEGTFDLTKTLNFSLRCSVPLGEAIGLFSAMQWLRDMSLDHIDFALDSKTVTDAFHHHRPDTIEFGQLMSASRRLFTSSFTNSRVEFKRRQAN